MAEYIDKEQLLSDLYSKQDDENLDVMLEIANFPAADVAQVVHCKDCRLRGGEDCAMFYRCDCGAQHTWETDNDFCSYGEKREDRHEFE
jgi:hypothetical protein